MHPKEGPSGSGTLVLEDGVTFRGVPLGAHGSVAGEVVFNTGMVGYLEALTDPSYKGQILVLTYPLIGNYGVPDASGGHMPAPPYESDRIQVTGLIVSEASPEYSHWSATRSFTHWLDDEHIPALVGVDTRALTKRLRASGTMLGKIVDGAKDIAFHDPDLSDLVSRVSVAEPIVYPGGPTPSPARRLRMQSQHRQEPARPRSHGDSRAVGLRLPRRGFRRSRDVERARRPAELRADDRATSNVLLDQDRPVFGICLGHQILALAAGREHLQAEVRPSQSESAVPRGRHEALLHHLAEPRLRRRHTDAATGVGPLVHQRQRRHQRGHSPPDPPVHERAVSPGGRPRPARYTALCSTSSWI